MNELQDMRKEIEHRLSYLKNCVQNCEKLLVVIKNREELTVNGFNAQIEQERLFHLVMHH